MVPTIRNLSPFSSLYLLVYLAWHVPRPLWGVKLEIVQE